MQNLYFQEYKINYKKPQMMPNQIRRERILAKWLFEKTKQIIFFGFFYTFVLCSTNWHSSFMGSVLLHFCANFFNQFEMPVFACCRCFMFTLSLFLFLLFALSPSSYLSFFLSFLCCKSLLNVKKLCQVLKPIALTHRTMPLSRV